MEKIGILVSANIKEDIEGSIRAEKHDNIEVLIRRVKKVSKPTLAIKKLGGLSKRTSERKAKPEDEPMAGGVPDLESIFNAYVSILNPVNFIVSTITGEILKLLFKSVIKKLPKKKHSFFVIRETFLPTPWFIMGDNVFHIPLDLNNEEMDKVLKKVENLSKMFSFERKNELLFGSKDIIFEYNTKRGKWKIDISYHAHA